MSNSHRTSGKLRKSSRPSTHSSARVGSVARNRRQHFHSYSRGVRRHWNRRTGGTNVGARGFRHTHGGSRHGHNFSTGVQQHWGRYPGGHSVHHEGYYHSHNAPHRGNTSTGYSTRGGGGSGMGREVKSRAEIRRLSGGNTIVEGNLLECWRNGNTAYHHGGNLYCKNKYSNHLTLIQ